MNDLIEDLLLEILPHGSGIDCKWQFTTQANGKIRAVNAFHCMDENGYYCGYQDFAVKLDPKLSAHEFILSFQYQRHLAERYQLRDFLNDTFDYALRRELEKLKLDPNATLEANAQAFDVMNGSK